MSERIDFVLVGRLLCEAARLPLTLAAKAARFEELQVEIRATLGTDDIRDITLEIIRRGTGINSTSEEVLALARCGYTREAILDWLTDY